MQQDANRSSPWPRARESKAPNQGARRTGGRSVGRAAKTFLLVMACGLLFGGGLAFLVGYLRPPAPNLAVEAENEQSAVAVSNRQGDDYQAAVPVSQLPITGNQYRVAVERAFLFGRPAQSVPLKSYLQRGDVFYADGDSNGFVRTSFVQADGTQSSGWLKLRELNKIADSPTSPVETAPAVAAPKALAVATPPRRPAKKPVWRRPRAAQSTARKPAARTRVGAWLRRTREKVLPRRQEAQGAKRQKKKVPPCKCAFSPVGLTRAASLA